MISPSSVSTRMTLASSVLVWRRPPAGAAGETAKLILVLEAHATAHSTAPGARLSDDLKDQVSTTSTGDRAPFSARNGAPRQGRPMTVRNQPVVSAIRGRRSAMRVDEEARGQLATRFEVLLPHL